MTLIMNLNVNDHVRVICKFEYRWSWTKYYSNNHICAIFDKILLAVENHIIVPFMELNRNANP